MELGKIRLPERYNYIGVFLTFRCNLGCDYCINGKIGDPMEMSGECWLEGLSRIITRTDLPITLQGGEPTQHEDFNLIVNYLDEVNSQKLDLITNGLFDSGDFMENIPYHVFDRDAPYASIRFSLHKKSNVQALVTKVWHMKLAGYNVGIWGLSHPKHQAMNEEARDMCRWFNVDFRLKEFLGKEGGDTYGTYKYPNGVFKTETEKVMCKPSELLIGPDGHIFRCHADLYTHRNPIGHILDQDIKFPHFYECEHFGQCNPCDLKSKFNRFQDPGHCSVEILKIGGENGGKSL